MKSIAFLIGDFSGRGIFLKENGGEIGYRARAGALTADDKATIRSRKSEFVTYLRARSFPEPAPTDKPRADPALPSFYQAVWWHWFKDVPLLLPYERVSLMKRFANAGAQDVAAALTRVVRRHDALRLFFRETENGPVMAIHEDADFPVEIRHLEDEAGLAQLLQDFFAGSPRVRDLWLIKACIIQLPDGDAVAAIGFHHTVCDGTSHQILSAELEAEVARPDSLSSNAALSYRAFAGAERDWFSGDAFAALTAYWSQWITRIPPLTSPDGKRALTWRFGERIVAQTSLDADAVTGLAHLAQARQASFFIVLLTALVLALRNWSGQSHFAVRSVADGRTHTAIGSTVGLILRHYLVEADIPSDWDATSLIEAMAREYESGAVLRFPTHWGSTGADFQSLHQQIAVTFNYLALPATRVEALAGLTPTGMAEGGNIIWKAAEDWPAALPPLQLRAMHFTDGLDLVFEFNGVLFTRNEQESLIAAVKDAMETLSAPA